MVSINIFAQGNLTLNQLKQCVTKTLCDQVAFNEALRRVAADKDRQLDNLRDETEQLRSTVERLSQAQAAAERDNTEQRETIRRLQQYQQRSSSRSHRHVVDTMSASVAVLT